MPRLDWLTRAEDEKAAARVPYRLLEHVPEHSYGDEHTENMLIQGDNLEALKALLPFYAGRVKCIFIDPPYNTRSAFTHYDDNLEHTQWLAMMYPRLELLRDLLSEEGSIWVTIDDNEAHYLKVVMDEVFGRNHFIANVLWQKRTSPDARLPLGAAHDHILVYGRSAVALSLNKAPVSEEQATKFKNPDGDPRGPWASTDFTAQGWRPNQMYRLRTVSGKEYEPPPGRCWLNVEAEFGRLVKDGRIWFGKNGDSRPRIKHFLSEKQGVASWTWWTNAEVGHNQESKKEILQLFGAENAFETPKPERLVRRIIEIATNKGDLVLDSFLGSGTTAAVAHKLHRQYICVETGNQATTHCVPRLRKVVDGEKGGVSEPTNWKGGGGFRFYKLGSPVFDERGKINPAVRFEHLAAHVWFSETHTPLARARRRSPLLGVHEETAYYLLFNGILGDKRPDGGNVLTRKVLAELPQHNGPKVIYGESSRLSADSMKRLSITFKQTPYDVKAR